MTGVDEGSVVWSDEEGTLLGVWNPRTRGYRVQNIEGDIRDVLEIDGVRVVSGVVAASFTDHAGRSGVVVFH
ncbi:hypothetical protein [Nocardiopsis aegyptia]|uniref:Uncharacterized protein n=1 Tax=Nocardiopsis aegyptia TaxID=220378 RepID=A0A7Z0JBK2_9ACTN|nr:hypothetical protein [Nocardiopsis aegyptia]NYJ35550.1 hypothetical protein [Nocardiopsis aegyptia]